jgi:hypothetical protein
LDLSRNRLLKIAQYFLLTLCIIRLWIVPLPSSFWVDETGTEFVVRQGANHPSLAVAPQVPASIYFWLPRIADKFLALLPAKSGVLESLYRLPSIVAAALALFFIARIAARLIDPQAARFAAFACLALSGFNYEAANARPYALGILVVSAATLFLIRWLDRGHLTDAALFVVFAALILRVHLLFWPAYLVLLLYALARQTNWKTCLVFALVAVSVIPLAPLALTLSKQAGEHVISPVPPIKELVRELKFGLIILAATLGFALSRIPTHVTEPRPQRSDLPSSRLLIAAWWLLPPVALYAFSFATGNSVFVHRYLSFALPGVALAATAAASFFVPKHRWDWATVILGTGVLIFLGNWSQKWPPHHNSDWRAAAASINALPNPTVLCPSPFIEARTPAWTPAYPLPGFLYAHLATYPIHGHLILFPYQASPLAEQWAGNLKLGSRFFIYGQAPAVEFWRTWFLSLPQYQRWTSQPLGSFGDVSAVAVSSPSSH